MVVAGWPSFMTPEEWTDHASYSSLASLLLMFCQTVMKDNGDFEV